MISGNGLITMHEGFKHRRYEICVTVGCKKEVVALAWCYGGVQKKSYGEVIQTFLSLIRNEDKTYFSVPFFIFSQLSWPMLIVFLVIAYKVSRLGSRADTKIYTHTHIHRKTHIHTHAHTFRPGLHLIPGCGSDVLAFGEKLSSTILIYLKNTA